MGFLLSPLVARNSYGTLAIIGVHFVSLMKVHDDGGGRRRVSPILTAQFPFHLFFFNTIVAPRSSPISSHRTDRARYRNLRLRGPIISSLRPSRAAVVVVNCLRCSAANNVRFKLDCRFPSFDLLLNLSLRKNSSPKICLFHRLLDLKLSRIYHWMKNTKRKP